MGREVSNRDKIINSRDVIARLEELQSERYELAAELEESEGSGGEEAKAVAKVVLDDWDGDNGDELKSLKELNEKGEGATSDWPDGATMIADYYFTEYMQEFVVSDIGDLPKNIPAYIVIDWDATANNLHADYTTITFDGADYYVR